MWILSSTVSVIRRGEKERMRNKAVAVSSSAAYTPDGRGAGGRLRRPFARKPPSTPYDCPLAQQRRSATTGSGRDWISKIVNPAYRLVAGGAARLLPFVFSSFSTDSLPVPLPTSEAAEEADTKSNSMSLWS
ncbi:hypothetical protein V2J09_017720 [Rumex salicifolius]